MVTQVSFLFSSHLVHEQSLTWRHYQQWKTKLCHLKAAKSAKQAARHSLLPLLLEWKSITARIVKAKHLHGVNKSLQTLLKRRTFLQWKYKLRHVMFWTIRQDVLCDGIYEKRLKERLFLQWRLKNEL